MCKKIWDKLSSIFCENDKKGYTIVESLYVKFIFSNGFLVLINRLLIRITRFPNHSSYKSLTNIDIWMSQASKNKNAFDIPRSWSALSSPYMHMVYNNCCRTKAVCGRYPNSTEIGAIVIVICICINLFLTKMKRKQKTSLASNA